MGSTFDYDREWRDNVSGQLRDLAEGQAETSQAVTRIEGKIMDRTAIQSLVETRVSKEVFEGERALVWAAIKGLQNGPAGVRAWVTVTVSVLALLVAGLCGGLSLLIQVWPHIH